MKKSLLLFLFLGLSLLVLAACGGAPTPVPTATAVSQLIVPTAPPTNEPPTAVPATPTTEVLPTALETVDEALFPTPIVTVVPTLTPVPEVPDYVLSITEPSTAATLLAGREVTFHGVVQPATSDPVTLTLMVGSFTAVSAQIIPDATSGSWELITTVAEAASGPGILTVTLADIAQAQQPIQLAFDNTTEAPYIALSVPVEGKTAVGGHAFFMSGDSNNLIDDTFSIGVMVDDCTNFIAAQKISLSSGGWYGFVILPQNAPPGAACAVAYTGEYQEEGWREAVVPIQIHAFNDEQISLLNLGNFGELSFTAGEATNLFGVAINIPDRAVDIILELDSTSGSRQVVATGKAFADQFGLWSIDLDLPDDAATGLGILTISGGTGDTYQEVRQTVTISP